MRNWGNTRDSEKTGESIEGKGNSGEVGNGALGAVTPNWRSGYIRFLERPQTSRTYHYVQPDVTICIKLASKLFINTEKLIQKARKRGLVLLYSDQRRACINAHPKQFYQKAEKEQNM